MFGYGKAKRLEKELEEIKAERDKYICGEQKSIVYEEVDGHRHYKDLSRFKNNFAEGIRLQMMLATGMWKTCTVSELIRDINEKNGKFSEVERMEEWERFAHGYNGKYEAMTVKGD